MSPSDIHKNAGHIGEPSGALREKGREPTSIAGNLPCRHPDLGGRVPCSLALNPPSKRFSLIVQSSNH